jgi:type IV secretory pathway VirB3-like protein
MTTPKVDLDVIHPSLTKPVLWGGVERRIVGLEFMIVVLLLTWKGITPVGLLLAACIVIPMHLIARRTAREDPRMFDLLLRSLTWRRHYPAHGRLDAPPSAIKPSIPRGR